MKYVSVSEMISIEKEADKSGHTYSQMMEYAGRGLAEVVRDFYRDLTEKSVLALVGSGNNGGDSLVALSYLQDWGWKTTAYIVRPRSDDDPLVQRFLASGGRLLTILDDIDYSRLKSSLKNHSVLMDGILGTGIRLPLRGQIPNVLDLVRRQIENNEHFPSVVAVDCPSGIDCDSGDAAPESIPAQMTVTMAAVKQGLLKFPAFNYVGDLRMVNIGLPDDLNSLESISREVIFDEWVRYCLPERPLDGHKGTFGTAILIGGSLNYCGAMLLAGEAAFRSGTGWVTLAIPEPLHGILAGRFLEGTWLILPHKDGFISGEGAKIINTNIGKSTAMLVGPGMGLQDTSLEFISKLLSNRDKLPPLIFDADGLKLVAKIPRWWCLVPKPAILTPHPGEMSILTGLPKDEIQTDRIQIAEKFAIEWGHVVVLKGAFTVIAAPDGRTAIIPVATPALARAGTGDVLAGLMVGLRAQGMKAFDAAVVGSWIHAQAGLQAAKMLGSTATVLAGDVLSALTNVYKLL